MPFEDCGPLFAPELQILTRVEKYDTSLLFMKLCWQLNRPFALEQILNGILQGASPQTAISFFRVPKHREYFELFAVAYHLFKKDPSRASIEYKLRRSPVQTKHTSLSRYAKNSHGLGLQLSLMWLKSQFTDIPEGVYGQDTLWNCENILSTPVAGIWHSLSFDFVQTTVDIIKQCKKQRLEKLGVCIFAHQYFAAMVIKIRFDKIRRDYDYISVVFYDPSSELGDVKIALNYNDESDWERRIKALIVYSFKDDIRPSGRDFSFICLNANPHVHARLTTPFRIPTSGDALINFLHNIIHCGGGSSGYLVAIFLSIEALLSRFPQIDVNALNARGFTLLYVASNNGFADVVKNLLRFPQINVNSGVIKGFTPLHIAARHGHIEVVRVLLGVPQIDVNATDVDGITPLHKAAQYGHVEVVRALLKMRIKS